NCHRRACALLRPGHNASRDQIWVIVQRGRASAIRSLRSVVVTTVTSAACHNGAAHSCRGQPCAGVAVTDVCCTDRIGSTALLQPHWADHTGNEPGWRTTRVASPDCAKHRFAFRHERQLVTLATHYTIATACNLVSALNH